MLVLLGAVPTGRSPSVEAERYVDLDDDEHFRISLERSNDEWSIVELDLSGRESAADVAWAPAAAGGTIPVDVAVDGLRGGRRS